MTETPAADLFVTHLPALYQEQDPLRAFLAPFESILLGGTPRLASEPAGLRETVRALPELLDPLKTGEEFLPWLASWVALTFRADLPAERMRLLIAHAGSLYAWRGTRKGLDDLLSIVTGDAQVTITEPEIVTLTVGVQAVIGSTTRLGRDLPYYFRVFVVSMSVATDDAALESFESLVRDTIEIGKPAHTYYTLDVSFAGSEHLAVTPGHDPSQRNEAGTDVGTSAQQ